MAIALAVLPLSTTTQSTQTLAASLKGDLLSEKKELQAFNKNNAFLQNTEAGYSTPLSLSPYQAISKIPHTISEYRFASRNWLLGNKNSIASCGIDPSITYTSDICGNPVGGKNPGGCTYVDNISFNCLFNTEKLVGWHDGYLLISAIQRDGVSLSEKNIGNEQIVQYIYGGGETFHFYELYYEQRTRSENASFKIGRFIPGTDFSSSPLYWLYMNQGIDAFPLSMVKIKFSIPPNAAWATCSRVNLTESTSVRVGAYQVTQKSVNGLNWNLYPNDGVMLLAQYEWDPEFFKPSTASAGEEPTKKRTPSHPTPDTPLPKGFLGHYWIGGLYSSFEYPQFNSTATRPNAFGLYCHADQTVYRPKQTGEEGLVLWVAPTLTPQENISFFPFMISGGAVYTGLIPGRHSDFSILGFSYVGMSSNQAAVQNSHQGGYPTYELMYEAGYRINLTKFSYIQPDLQWILNPGGTTTIPNALVLGVQVGVVF